MTETKKVWCPGIARLVLVPVNLETLRLLSRCVFDNFGQMYIATKQTEESLRNAARVPQPQYKSPAGDDRRERYCPSCEWEVKTVPLDGVVNQSARCCECCGFDTESEGEQ